MRRLLVYLVLDTSGSMKGEPIESVKVGLQTLVSSLRQDPYALETVHLAIITFDREAKVVAPLESLGTFRLPNIETPDAGPTHMGLALEKLCADVDLQMRTKSSEQKADWRPLLFLMTDGSPSDLKLYRDMIPEVRRRQFGTIVACAAGMKAKTEFLRELTDTVVSLDTTDAAAFRQFFQWVSSTISSGSKSQGTASAVLLPPPPPEVHPAGV